MEKDIRLSKKEQETIISFNTGEKTATVYTRDKAVIIIAPHMHSYPHFSS